MTDLECPEFARLEADAHEILKKLHHLTADQLRALEKREDRRFARLDGELEHRMGEKERAIGALRQHAAEHGCRPEFIPGLC